MREKASTGVYPGHAPFGYVNNKADRTIEIDRVDAPMVKRLMDLYATGAHTLTTLRRFLQTEFGKTMSKGNIHLILKNRFYIGWYTWAGEEFAGTHELFVDRQVFDRVQEVLAGHNRPKPQKRELAFRGLMNCSHDGCMLTGDVQREKYVYYRCSGSRGECDLPRFREEVIAERLGECLRGLQVPVEIAQQIVAAVADDDDQARERQQVERDRLDGRLRTIHTRMDAAYTDKLDGKIDEDFWQRKMSDWKVEEQGIRRAIGELEAPEGRSRSLDLGSIDI